MSQLRFAQHFSIANGNLSYTSDWSLAINPDDTPLLLIKLVPSQGTDTTATLSFKVVISGLSYTFPTVNVFTAGPMFVALPISADPAPGSTANIALSSVVTGTDGAYFVYMSIKD
jgi:hypothetical protein